MGDTNDKVVAESQLQQDRELDGQRLYNRDEKEVPERQGVGTQLEGPDPVAAVTKAVNILEAKPGVTAAFSTTGGGCNTWTGAEAQANVHLAVIYMDYVPENLALVQSGTVFGLVTLPLFQEGRKQLRS